MVFVRRLVVRLLAVLLIPFLLGWYVADRYFLVSDAQRSTLAALSLVSIAVSALLQAFAVRSLGAPIVDALRPDGQADQALQRRGVIAALRLPGRLAGLLMVLSAAIIASFVLLEVRQGLALDVAIAGAGSAVAFTVMGAMLGYSVALDASARVLLELRSTDIQSRGTSVRGKVLVVCCGLLAVSTLLLLPVSYMQYREDVTRRYAETAASVQERGARRLDASRTAEVADLVYGVTGAPTAVFESGRIAARAPGGTTVLAVDRSPPGTGIEDLPGGWRVWRSSGTFTIVSFLPDDPLRHERQAFWSHAPQLGLLLLGACALLVWLAARTLTIPIQLLGRAADRIASGDLTVSPPSVSRDELGQLAADFRNMAQGLAALVNDVQAASRGVLDGARDMDDIGERVKGGAREEHDRVVALQSTVEAMHGSVQLVGRGVESLTDYVHSTSAALGEMAAAIEEVRRQAAEMESRMATATNDMQKLSDAGGRAQAQLGALGTLAGNAQATLGSVSGSLAGLERSAIASQLAAAQAAEMADHAGGVVQDALGGIESVRSAVDDAKKRVAVLWRRSDDIDKILDFIGEVAGRTNLLSLNASIIATQAGEHGKAFGVVADQIRELAAQISSSTKSIGQIIRAVRDDVNGTARLIDRGDALAAEGVAHARKSLDALQGIRVATAKGHETAAAIRDAVQAHAVSTRDVSNLVVSVTGTSQALSEAIQMVGTSVAAVGSVTDGVRALADKVSRALDEQTGVGRHQLESLELIDSMLADITRAIGNHEDATARVREVLAQLTRTAEQHDAAVVELSGVADRLGARSRALAERVGRFKI